MCYIASAFVILCRTNRLAITLFLMAVEAVLAAGCSEVPASHPKDEGGRTFADQLADVRAGRRDRIVVLDGSGVDVDLSVLREVPQLVHLELPRRSVGDRDVDALGRLKRLQVLVLGETNLTDVGLQSLARLHELHRLNLPRVEAGTTGLAAVAALPELQLLRIGGPNVTDDALKSLTPAKSLRSLILCRAPITDAGLPALTPMTNLESLYLDGTEVTEAGARYLNGARPDLHVHFP
jgi:hypothetical protein